MCILPLMIAMGVVLDGADRVVNPLIVITNGTKFRPQPGLCVWQPGLHMNLAGLCAQTLSKRPDDRVVMRTGLLCEGPSGGGVED